jgi:phage baseplate assembly protein W
MPEKEINPAKAFLGIGWAFPVQEDQNRDDIALAAYEEDIRQALLIILETNHGERVMRPDFGANLHALVFEPINTTTLTLVRHQVQEAITLWEPRVDNLTIQLTADPPIGRLMIDISYRVRQTNTFYNLVYPFYSQEGSGEFQ